MNGNVRRTSATYPDLANPGSADITTSKYYRYDSMNRMVVADGQLSGTAGASGTTIVRGMGEDITYDAAGRRATQTRNAEFIGRATNTTGDHGGHFDVAYDGARREEYSYRDDGELLTVKFAETGYTDNEDGTVSPTSLPSSGTLRAQYDRDAMGRITEYQEFATNGTTVTRDRTSIVYDARGNIGTETVYQTKVESGVTSIYRTDTTNTYTSYGLLTSVANVEWKGGVNSALPDTLMSYSYGWYDGARISSTSFDSDIVNTSNTIFTSTYYSDSLGRVASVDIADGRRRTVSFAYTPGGQALNRKERSAATANPEDQHYFVAGAQYGELTSNGNNDPELVDYAQSLTMRNQTPAPASAPFRWNTTSGLTVGIFGPAGYQALNPIGDGTNASDSGYIVRAGETLQSIAAGVWGDASLWYLIADANGMSGGETLAAGTSLILPDRVTNAHNNGDTFRVYDPNRALGDLNPTSAKPPKKAGGCGIVGQILVIAVAIAVTALLKVPVTGLITGLLTGSAAAGTAAATTAAVVGGIAGAAATGAIASTVSQGFAVATGIQDKLSFKGVALSALSAGITQGIGGGPLIHGAGKFVNDAARGMLANAATQGIGVATGLQDKFSWAGVAAAGVVSGVSGAASRGLSSQDITGRVNEALAGTLSSFAGAGARSLIEGTDFGDNLKAVLPDVIGSTIGNALGDAFAGATGGSGSRGSADAGEPIGLLQNLPDVTPHSLSLESVLMTEDQLAAAMEEPTFVTAQADFEPGDPRSYYRYINDNDDQLQFGEGRLLQEGVDRTARFTAFPPRPPWPEDAGPFHVEEPTFADYRFANQMRSYANLAPYRGWIDASRNLLHWLDASGTPLTTLDIGGMLEDIPHFQEDVAQQYQTYVVGAAERKINQNYNSGTMHFEVITPWQHSDGAADGNWFYALGGFSFSHTALITATAGADGLMHVRVDPSLHVYDQYNWNLNLPATIPPVRIAGITVLPGMTFNDNDMRHLKAVGLGQDYEVRGTLRGQYQTFTMPIPRHRGAH